MCCDKYYCVFIILFVSTSTASDQKYRNDYVYSAKANAFYKLHTNEVAYLEALSICAAEGAALLVPVFVYDIAQAHGMLKEFPDLGDYVWIGNDGNSHESAEEVAIINLESSREELDRDGRCTVLTRGGDIDTNNCLNYRLPFVCKVAAKDAYYDKKCDVYGADYKYIESVGSCYKIPGIAFTWNQAFAECRAQAAHLVVLNSEAESQAVLAVMRATKYITGSHSIYYYIAGIRANQPTDGTSRVFRTIFNETLEEAGFAKWAATEPNNFAGTEYCGSLYESDGRYNDHNCDHPYGFICEKEVHL